MSSESASSAEQTGGGSSFRLSETAVYSPLREAGEGACTWAVKYEHVRILATSGASAQNVNIYYGEVGQ